MKIRFICLSIMMLSFVNMCEAKMSMISDSEDNDSIFVISAPHYSIKIIKNGFRYSILNSDGDILLRSDLQSGLLLLHSPVVKTRMIDRDKTRINFEVENDIGVKAHLSIKLFDSYFKMSVKFLDPMIKGSIIARTKGLAPAYGLADHAAFKKPYSTEVTGYKSEYFGARTGNGAVRLVSNFVIFPKQGIAAINLEPGKKIVTVNLNELAQGTFYSDKMPALYYFIGPPKQIYADFLEVRNNEGYEVYKPKYDWFGVGWEAFGALGWNTNYKTVKDDIDHYLKLGFPLSWMVVGSGFWPDEPQYFSTTSFGFWNREKYPAPQKFIGYFHSKGLKFILGLRIAFIPNGPYTKEGLEKGFFIKENNSPRLFKIGFPKPDCYFLDASNPAAVDWYVELCAKWESSGVDGFKEDIYGYDITGLPDNKLDAVNAALMDKGVFIMGRNGYVGSPMDIHRYDDFNYNQNQDRGPVNGLAFAYSGFPNVYPDIVGGTGLTNRQFGDIEEQKIGKYLMREAQYAAVNPSMSFGYGPWNFKDKQVLNVCLNAAQLHDRLQAYIYSAAIQSYKTGFPSTMTPLPLAFPHDSATYYRENEKEHGYQWLIGDALMAIPLYGDDYAKNNVRNIYLPEGKWIDYDNGKVYNGTTTLKDFPLPVGKTPLFVGGSGFVVEKINNKLYGRIYPVGFEGKTVFYDKDGQMKSEVKINDFDGNTPSVYDQTEKRDITVRLNNYAWQFEFVPGHNYSIK